RQFAWALDKPEVKEFMLALHSDTEAYRGRLGKARELSKQAADTAENNDQRETAALFLLNASLREAELGNAVETRKLAGLALTVASTRDLQILAALSLARAGDVTPAQTTLNNLSKSAHLNILAKGYWLPTIRAAIELDHMRPENA